MTRIKRGVTKHKRKKYILKRTKGFTNRRRTNLAAAREALLHAGAHAYSHRRLRKRDFKSLWTIRINAAAREQGLTFSRFLDKLHKNKIGLNKKMLSELAARHPKAFESVIKEIK